MNIAIGVWALVCHAVCLISVFSEPRGNDNVADSLGLVVSALCLIAAAISFR